MANPSADLIEWLLAMQGEIDVQLPRYGGPRPDQPERIVAALQVLSQENQQLKAIARTFIELAGIVKNLLAMLKSRNRDDPAFAIAIPSAMFNVETLVRQAREILGE